MVGGLLNSLIGRRRFRNMLARSNDVLQKQVALERQKIIQGNYLINRRDHEDNWEYVGKIIKVDGENVYIDTQKDLPFWKSTQHIARDCVGPLNLCRVYRKKELSQLKNIFGTQK